ncbi:MAG TPA: lysylphosphatidylglycerol synthase domain-containing protein [Steroidobacteraceae bacterium]|jgi:putative membrane protein|nr:lysylphosphatidylglycerol synthase domain-containing protein [Steroidobacteraceae bacterium]
MKWRSAVGLILGAAVLAGTLVYAGAGAVVHSLEGLRLTGLLILVLAHLPIEALMGTAWWLATGTTRTASPRRFMWARLVRDAAAETLPFSQLGGFVLGVRALRLSGPTALRGVLSMSVDLIIELGAKLPYVLVGVLVLLALAPGSGLMRPLGIGLVLTAAALAAAVLARRRLGNALDRLIRKISQRWPELASLRQMNLQGDTNAVLDDILAHRGRLALAFGLHLLCWFLGAAELWLIFELLGKPVSAPEALVIDGVVAGLRTFVFMVPVAAGVQEASYVLACAVFGIAPAAAVAASLARRARDLTLGAATLALALGTDRAIIRGPRETSCRS